MAIDTSKKILVPVSAETHSALKRISKANGMPVQTFCDALISARVCTLPLPTPAEVKATQDALIAAQSAVLAEASVMAARIEALAAGAKLDKGEQAPTLVDVLALLKRASGN